MSRVDFYLLKQTDPKARYPFTCRLVEKAYHHKHKIYIHTADEKEAHLLDDLLWTFKDESFLPHNLYGEGPNPPPAIQIGFTDNPSGFNDVLINLSAEVPSFYKRFKRVIEIIPEEDNWKTKARKNFKTYRQNGAELKTHKIS